MTNACSMSAVLDGPDIQQPKLEKSISPDRIDQYSMAQTVLFS